MSNFKLILEKLIENINADVLRIAIKHKNGIEKGRLYDTHYNLVDKLNLNSTDERDYGFITPKGLYLNRKDSLKWIKQYTPEIYKEYVKLIKKAKPQEPEFGYNDELESVGYRKALGIESI